MGQFRPVYRPDSENNGMRALLVDSYIDVFLYARACAKACLFVRRRVHSGGVRLKYLFFDDEDGNVVIKEVSLEGRGW